MKQERDRVEIAREAGRASGRALTPEQRVERARQAGRESRSIRTYVRAISKRPAELTPEDLAVLRDLVGPVDHAEVYERGLRDGAAIAKETVVRALDDAEVGS